MATKKVVVLPGDDAAPEAVGATMDVLRAMKLDIEFNEFPTGEHWVRRKPTRRARAIDALGLDAVRIDLGQDHLDQLSALGQADLRQCASVPLS